METDGGVCAVCVYLRECGGDGTGVVVVSCVHGLFRPCISEKHSLGTSFALVPGTS